MAEVPEENRYEVVLAGLTAAGVGVDCIDAFAERTRSIIEVETNWELRGMDIFGPGIETMPGPNYGPRRGLVLMTPSNFYQYHAHGTSIDIYDPVAQVASLWLFIADRFGVDLRTGAGLDEFYECRFRPHPRDRIPDGY